MIPLLALRDVHAGYDSIEVLHGVSVHVDAGEVVVLLGANGAGKSTLLSVASGMLVPTAGQLLVAGQDLTGTGAGDLARAGICTVPEGRSVFPSLTVAEHLLMMTHRGVSAADVVAAVDARLAAALGAVATT